MYFKINENLMNGSGVVYKKEVIVAVEVDGKVYGATDLLCTDLIYKLSIDRDILLAKTDNYTNPIITLREGVKANSCDVLYGLVMKNKEKLKEDSSKTVFADNVSKKTGMSMEIIRCLIDSMLKYDKYLDMGAIKAAIKTPFRAMDCDFLEDTQTFFYDNVITKTLFMEDEFSEVSLRLPTREELQDDWIDSVPYIDDICKQYPDNVIVDPDYKNNVTVPKSMYSMIEGNTDNNTLPLQQNELGFYNNLVKWIIANTEAVIPNQDPNSIDFVTSKDVSGYLKELIGVIYSSMWSHSMYVPEISREDGALDDVESLGTSKYIFFSKTGSEGTLPKNAIILLHLYLESAEKVLGFKVWAEAVVRLLRWASRKQTKLVFDGYDRVFNLSDGSIEQSMGDLNDYVIKSTNGKEYRLVKVFRQGSTITDTDYFSNIGINSNMLDIPTMVELHKVLENKNNGKEYTVVEYVSCMELIDGIKDGTFSIDNINEDYIIDEAKFSDNNAISAINSCIENKNSFVCDPLYLSNGLRNLYMKYGGSNQTHLVTVIDRCCLTSNIKRNIENDHFSSKEELLKKLENYEIMSADRAIQLNIFCMVKDIIGSVAHEWNGDVSTVLKAYKNAIDRFGSPFSNSDNSGNTQQVGYEKTNNSGASTDTVGDSCNKNGHNDNIDFIGIPDHMLYDKETVPTELKPLVTTSGSLVGYIYIYYVYVQGVRRQRYILYSVEYGKDNKSVVLNDNVRFNELIYYLVSKFYMASKGSAASTIMFHDEDSFISIKDKLLEAAKRGEVL